MYPITAIELQLVVESIGPLGRGERVEKIFEPDRNALVVVTRSEHLLFHLHPLCAHFGFAERPTSRGESSPFTMLLRKHLSSSLLREVSLLRPGERVLKLCFSTGHTLLAELTGRHANLFLLDDAGRILGSLRGTGSTTRPLRPGASYTPPPLPDSPPPHRPPRFSDPQGAVAFFAPFLAQEHLAARRHQALQPLRARLKKITRAQTALARDRRRCQNLLQERRLGELMLIVQYSWPPGARTLALDPAPDGGEALTLTLTLPRRITTPTAASQYFFSRYKKGKRGLQQIALREAALKKEAALLQERIATLQKAPLELLPEICVSPRGVPVRSKTHSKKKKYKFFRQFTGEGGAQILVGRSAQENHQLTFSVAKGNDTWMHARDLPGAHVVILGEPNPSPQLKREAATLALHYSEARREGQGEVIVALRKHLRPVKGEPGRVTVAKSSTLFVRIDLQLLQRLLSPETRK